MPSALNIPVLKTTDASFEAAFQARLHWSGETDSAIEDRVAEIIAAVRGQGDAAVLAYTKQFDVLPAEQMSDLEITQAEMKVAFEGLPADQQTAFARTMRPKKRPQGSRGSTPMQMVICWDKKSLPWIVLVSMCPAAKPLIRRVC
jgi:hypothetical protein